jgi:UDP-N-acetylmuramoyl-tripeptide--D-alanyl-D-alanine ligase
MFELGNHAATHHQQVGEKCSQLPLDAVFTVGKETVATEQAITRITYHKHYATKDELSQELLAFLQPHDKVLVKGSRGMAMETIIQALVKN